MPLPSGIETCTVTFGKALGGALGTQAVISGTVEVDRDVIWAATGDSLYGVPETLPDPTGGGWVAFTLPFVDQPGFIDTAGDAVTNFAFTLRATIEFPNRTIKVTKPFQVFDGQSNVDIDLIPGGTIEQGVTAPSASVLSVAGRTGTVTAQDLIDAGVGGLDDAGVAGRIADPTSATALELAISIAAAILPPPVDGFRQFVQAGGITTSAPFVPIGDSKTDDTTGAQYLWDRLQNIRNQPGEGFEGVPAAAILPRGFNGSTLAAYLAGSGPAAALALHPSTVMACFITNDARLGGLGSTVPAITAAGADLLVTLYDLFMTDPDAPDWWIWRIPAPVTTYSDPSIVSIDPQVMTTGIRLAYYEALRRRPKALVYDPQARLFGTTSPTSQGELYDPTLAIHQSVLGYEVEGDDFAAWVDAAQPYSEALAIQARLVNPAAPWTVYFREVEDPDRYALVGEYLLGSSGTTTFIDIKPVVGPPAPGNITGYDLLEVVGSRFTYMLPAVAAPGIQGGNVRILNLAIPGGWSGANGTKVRVWRRRGSADAATDAAVRDTSYGRKFIGRISDASGVGRPEVFAYSVDSQRATTPANLWTPQDGDVIYTSGVSYTLASGAHGPHANLYRVTAGGAVDFSDADHVGRLAVIVGAQV